MTSMNNLPGTHKLKRPSVICPNCRHSWKRKPSAAEILADNASSHFDKKTLLCLLHPYCALCGLKINTIKEATVDHIYPKVKGGKNTLINWQLAHEECNQDKGSKFYHVLKK